MGDVTAVRSPTRTVSDADADTLVRLGGYTHPLFHDPAVLAASPFERAPLPGQALLLLMGGLAEQSGAHSDDTLALLGFDGVSFAAPVFAGDTLTVEVLPGEREAARGDRHVERWTWRAVRADGTLLAEAAPRFLVRGALHG